MLELPVGDDDSAGPVGGVAGCELRHVAHVQRPAADELHSAEQLGSSARPVSRSPHTTVTTPGGRMSAQISPRIGTDYMFAVPTARLAEAHAPHPGGTWRYEFTWSSPGYDGTLGACHGLELPFVFDTIGRVDYGVLDVRPDDETVRELAERMHASWIAFARDGDPGWPGFTPDTPVVQRIGTDWTTTTTADGPERELWQGIR
ncbi:carboxylesterase family protein [Kitasatospora sp. NPDC101235]|uniref:carboxylesterase family protein n=1 Tax=Kitasatospora sp. NPDC101235 TaxID=3364101 RepID=UPI0037F117D4